MSLINKEVSDFSVQAFQNNEFKTVTKADLQGKWSVFFFYPADFTFICPTELEDLANKYEEFKKSAARFIRYPVIPISYTRHGMMHLRGFKRFSILCSLILHMRFPEISRYILNQMVFRSVELLL